MLMLPEEQETVRPLANDHVAKLSSMSAGQHFSTSAPEMLTG
jgi:hypothetical protein